MMETLRDQGVGIIFISHKLNEVMDICERYMVLRDGELVAEGKVRDVTTDDLARFMVGHDVRTGAAHSFGQTGRGSAGGGRPDSQNSFPESQFSVRRGEILGFTGLLGDGRSELFQAIFGAEEILSGRVWLEGREVKIQSTGHALALGMGYSAPKSQGKRHH